MSRLIVAGTLSAVAGCNGFITPAGETTDNGESGPVGSAGSGGVVGGGESGADGAGGTIGDGSGTGGSVSGGGGNVGAGTGSSGSGSGSGNSSGTGNSSGSGTGGSSSTGMRSTPGDLPLPRLSHDEYLQTVQDLMSTVIPSDASAIFSGVMTSMTNMPADALVTVATEKHGGFARIDQSEQQQYSDVPVSVAFSLGTALTSSAARINTLFGTCSKNGTAVDAACLKSFVQTFGAIALRHPLADSDVTFYTGTITASPPYAAKDLANVIAVMLASPRFLYHVESGSQAVTGATNLYALDPWELASRLSYHFWGTMPDAALRDAATSGKLATDAGYASEVDRLMNDPRAAATLRTFFKQWFWPIEELPALDSRVSDPVFKSFAGPNLPGPNLRDHMVTEVLDASAWVTTHKGTLADLLTNHQAFAKDADLAAIYGVPVWDGKSEPATLPPERVGLLTRPAFLATGTADTRPIMKGVFIRTTLLCDAIPPPPNNAAATPIVKGAGQTTRDSIVALTEASGSVCSGCHKTLINPLGFASENFDSLGRSRTQQTFYDSSGKVTGMKAVDTTSTPGVVPGDAATSTGMSDLTQAIVKSGKVEKCLAAKYFRFAFRRLESANDSDTITSMAQQASSGTLADFFKGVVLRPDFKQRVITP